MWIEDDPQQPAAAVELLPYELGAPRSRSGPHPSTQKGTTNATSAHRIKTTTSAAFRSVRIGSNDI